MAEPEFDEEAEELRNQQQQEYDSRVVPLRSVDDYNRLVRDDGELLVCVVAMSSQCPHSVAMRDPLMKLAKPRNVTKNAAWFRFDVHEVPELAQQLAVKQVPTTFFTLKGVQWDSATGNGMERLAGVFKNNLLKRNDVMREHDLAKLPKPEEEVEEAEEGEEGDAEEED